MSTLFYTKSPIMEDMPHLSVSVKPTQWQRVTYANVLMVKVATYRTAVFKRFSLLDGVETSRHKVS